MINVIQYSTLQVVHQTNIFLVYEMPYKRQINRESLMAAWVKEAEMGLVVHGHRNPTRGVKVFSNWITVLATNWVDVKQTEQSR